MQVVFECLFGAAPELAESVPRKKAREEAPCGRERYLIQLLEALPAAIYTTGTCGCVTFYNQVAVGMWGGCPELGSDRWCGSWRLYWPDGRPLPHDQCAVALRENRPVRGVEAVLERPDGTRIPFIPYPTPLRDASGAVVGAVNMLVDITPRKQVEERELASLILLQEEAADRARDELERRVDERTRALAGANCRLEARLPSGGGPRRSCAGRSTGWHGTWTTRRWAASSWRSTRSGRRQQAGCTRGPGRSRRSSTGGRSRSLAGPWMGSPCSTPATPTRWR